MSRGGGRIAILTPPVEAIAQRIVFVNNGFFSIYRLACEDVIGQTPLILDVVERHQTIFDACCTASSSAVRSRARRRRDGSEPFVNPTDR